MFKSKIIAGGAVVCLLLATAGFERDSKDSTKAPPDMAAIKAELVKVKALLADTQKERDALKEALAKATAVPAEPAISKEQFEKAAAERDDAFAQLQQANINYTLLLTQLQDQTQKALFLQQRVNEMRTTINILMYRLDNGAAIMPRPSLKGVTVMPYPRL